MLLSTALLGGLAAAVAVRPQDNVLPDFDLEYYDINLPALIGLAQSHQVTGAATASTICSTSATSNLAPIISSSASTSYLRGSMQNGDGTPSTTFSTPCSTDVSSSHHSVAVPTNKLLDVPNYRPFQVPGATITVTIYAKDNVPLPTSTSVYVQGFKNHQPPPMHGYDAFWTLGELPNCHSNPEGRVRGCRSAGYGSDENERPYHDAAAEYNDSPQEHGSPDRSVPDYDMSSYDTYSYVTPGHNNLGHGTPSDRNPDHSAADYEDGNLYDTPEYDTPDYNVPEQNTPNDDIPDQDTPYHKTPDSYVPDHSTPAYGRDFYDTLQFDTPDHVFPDHGYRYDYQPPSEYGGPNYGDHAPYEPSRTEHSNDVPTQPPEYDTPSRSKTAKQYMPPPTPTIVPYAPDAENNNFEPESPSSQGIQTNSQNHTIAPPQSSSTTCTLSSKSTVAKSQTIVPFNVETSSVVSTSSLYSATPLTYGDKSQTSSISRSSTNIESATSVVTPLKAETIEMTSSMRHEDVYYDTTYMVSRTSSSATSTEPGTAESTISRSLYSYDTPVTSSSSKTSISLATKSTTSATSLRPWHQWFYGSSSASAKTSKDPTPVYRSNYQASSSSMKQTPSSIMTPSTTSTGSIPWYYFGYRTSSSGSSANPSITSESTASISGYEKTTSSIPVYQSKYHYTATGGRTSSLSSISSSTPKSSTITTGHWYDYIYASKSSSPKTVAASIATSTPSSSFSIMPSSSFNSHAWYYSLLPTQSTRKVYSSPVFSTKTTSQPLSTLVQPATSEPSAYWPVPSASRSSAATPQPETSTQPLVSDHEVPSYTGKSSSTPISPTIPIDTVDYDYYGDSEGYADTGSSSTGKSVTYYQGPVYNSPAPTTPTAGWLGYF